MPDMNSSHDHDLAVSRLASDRQVAIEAASSRFASARYQQLTAWRASVALTEQRMAVAADAYNRLPAERPTDEDGAKAYDATVAEHVAARAALDALSDAGQPDGKALRDQLDRDIAAADAAFNSARAAV
jgi:hypothetical protein